MDKLAEKGCIIINRNRELKSTKNIANANDDILFTGHRNLSGVFALSYATKYLNYDKIYLFGYDFGTIKGKTHFYNNIMHSGIGKDRAYLDREGKILPAIKDFDNFKGYNITIVGDSNIDSFEKITYKEFKRRIS